MHIFVKHLPKQTDCSMLDVQPQFVFVPSIVPVIATAVALFLATNGPHNWPALWQELTNPPADARHAIRKPSPYSYVMISQAELEMRRAQLMTYVQVYGIPLDTRQQHNIYQCNRESSSCAPVCPNLALPKCVEGGQF